MRHEVILGMLGVGTEGFGAGHHSSWSSCDCFIIVIRIAEEFE